MDTTTHGVGGAQGYDLAGADATTFWRACAALRAGEIAAGIAPLLTLAWVASSALRARVRAVLAGYGAAVSDDPAPIGGEA